MSDSRQIAVNLGIDSEDGELKLLGPVIHGEPAGTQIRGTKALMLAVLEDAIRCYLDGGKHLSEEAEQWIETNRRHSPFTFVIVSETLGLDPQAVRVMLRAMKERRVSSRQAIPRARKNVRAAGRVCTRIKRAPSRLRRA